MHKLRAYVPAVIFLAGCVAIWKPHAQVSVPLAAPLTTILPTVPGYTTHEQHVTDEERRVAGMSDYVARAYARDSTIAFTTLVSYYDHQAQGKTIHSPRNCLPGAGWEILRGGVRVVNSGGRAYTVNHYILKNGPETAVAYYWYEGRGRVVASEYVVKWNLLRDAALRGRTEEALVRVVVYIEGSQGGGADAATLEKGYARANAMGDDIASRLIGEVANVLPAKSSMVAVQ
jgi:EpsI family protein